VSVVDASLGVKWFVEEPGSDLARKLLDDEKGSLRIPDIFVVETAATLVRIANQDKSSVEST
jgi:predicted nucleic acid-binding protein